MRKKTKKRILFYTALYIIVGIFLYHAQEKFIYFPTSPFPHNAERISFKNDGCTLDVIVIHPKKETNKALLYFGGNGETVAFNINDFQENIKDRTVFLFNYRGYGHSTGKPSEKANYSDAIHLFELVRRQYTNIAVMGRSLGTGVATFLASKYTISHLILVTPYDSIESIAQSKLLIYPMSILLHEKYSSIKRVKNIQSKCLILIAENDETIPRVHSMRLAQAFPHDQVITTIIKDVGHNTISDDKKYFKLISEFINDTLEHPE